MENFDNNIRTRLNEHGTPLPDLMFERVMSARKKNPKTAVWWYFGSVIGLIGGLAWYGLSGSKDSASSNQISVKEQVTKSETSTNYGANTTNRVVTTSDRVGEERADIVKAMKRENKNLGLAQQNSQNQGSVHDIKILSNVKNITLGQPDVIENSIKTIENNAPNRQISYTDVVVDNRSQISKTETINNIAYLPALMPQKLQFERKLLGLWPEVVCPTFSRKSKSYWFVEAYGGGGLLQRSLQPKATESNSYLSLRKSTEKAGANIASGLHVGLRLGNGIVLKTGCEWQQANTIFEVKIADYELITRDPNTGAVLSSVKGERYKKTFNRSQFVQVPLLLGYEKGNRNWRIAVTGGVTMNIFTHYKGDVLSPIDAKQTITYTDGATNKTELYQKKPGLGVQASLQLIRTLDNGFSLYVAPQYDMILKTIATDTNPIEEKIGFLNVTIGVRKEF